VPQDPLVNGTQCALDAALMKTLGTNAIRVYHVDATADHTACMQTFDAAGIYAFIDLDDFDTQINQVSPPLVMDRLADRQDDAHWNSSQLAAFQKVMDAFHSFENVAGFYIGNEVVTMANGSAAAPFVKAATRDLKAYRDSKNYRAIPVGYSAADIASLRPMLQDYLVCGDQSSAIEFFSLNAYEWCGDNSYFGSGYQALTENVTEFPIPIFFSETGCNTIRPRTFSDQAAIFGPQMSPYWSGAIIYEWIQENNDYGIIQYGPHVDPASPGAPQDGWPRSGVPQPLQPEFGNLQQQWASASPSGVSAAAYSPTAKMACPAETPGVWNVNAAAALPPVPQGGVNYGVNVTAPSTSSSTHKSFASKTVAPPTTALVAVAVATTHSALTVISSALGWRGATPALVLVTICWFAVGGFV
jgi:hypothetical protein